MRCRDGPTGMVEGNCPLRGLELLCLSSSPKKAMIPSSPLPASLICPEKSNPALVKAGGKE